VRGLAVAVIASAIGCGRIAFDERGDARVDMRGDSSDAATSCWDAWASGPTFTSVARVAELSLDTSADKNAFLAADGLTLYFASTRSATNVEFWRARRPTVDQPFVVEGPMTDLNSTADEGRIVVDDTGLFGVVSSRRAGGAGNNDLWIATRTGEGAPFVLDRAPSAGLDSGADDKDPSLRPGRQLLYSVNQSEFRISDWTGTSYAAPQVVADGTILPGATSLSDPQLSPDDLVLAFVANVGDGQDFYRSVRTSKAVPFPVATLVDGLSTPVEEQDLSITPDGCEVWFTRASPTDDIWHGFVE
jgi:hypothetical protein